jgi:hypothetical protein
MNVLFCDDNPSDCEQATLAALEGASGKIKCTQLHSNGLKTALVDFFKAFDSALKGNAFKTAFDGYDMIVLDNNLSHLNIEGARLTAESIAGYIRAISDAPYVVSLNKNPEVDFDLRYLVGDYATKADLAINVGHLENKGLWTGQSDGTQFKPWYWPALLGSPNRRRSQIEYVTKNMDASVLDAFGFTELSIAALSRHAKGALSPEAEEEKGSERPVSKISFRDFFKASPRSIPAQEDRAPFSEQNALPVMARVISGELEAWFRRDVLGPQDALVDVPHLLLRMPFLLDKPADLASWNSAAASTTAPFEMSTKLFDKHLAPAAFAESYWLPTPAFWWQPLKADGHMSELFFKSEADWGDYVFCEDTSNFLSRSSEPEPLEFAAEYDGAWNRRHIARLKNLKYAPRSRLAM